MLIMGLRLGIEAPRNLHSSGVLQFVLANYFRYFLVAND